MSDIKTWSTAAASNNAASPNGFPEGMPPSGVNDSAREAMAAVRRWYENAQWIDLGDPPVYASANTFTFASDKTATYTTGRRLKLTDASTLYGTISTCAYSAPNTTVTVALDAGSLSGALSAVALGALTPSNSSIPTVPIASGGTGGTTAAVARTSLSAQQDVITTRGDLVRGSATNVAERVALGVRGQIVVSDGADVKWGMLLRSHLAGLQLANNTGAPTTKIDVSAGACADDTNAVIVSQAAPATIDCTTTGAWGLDTGILGSNTWYHIFKIMKADGTDSVVASTSPSSPTMPSGYSYKRRIGSFKTDGSAHIVGFIQFGDRFLLKTPALDYSSTPSDTNAFLVTLTTPNGIRTVALLNILAQCTSNGGELNVYLSSTDCDDLAPGGVSNLVSPLATIETYDGGNGNASGSQAQIVTNANSQIRARVGIARQFGIATLGWFDRRGRDD